MLGWPLAYQSASLRTAFRQSSPPRSVIGGSVGCLVTDAKEFKCDVDSVFPHYALGAPKIHAVRYPSGVVLGGPSVNGPLVA